LARSKTALPTCAVSRAVARGDPARGEGVDEHGGLGVGAFLQGWGNWRWLVARSLTGEHANLSTLVV
jgi:hypothetical protein